MIGRVVVHTFPCKYIVMPLLFSVAAKLEFGKISGRQTSKGGQPTTFSGLQPVFVVYSGLHHPFLVGSPPEEACRSQGLEV